MPLFTDSTSLDKKHCRILRDYSRYFDIKAPYKIIVGPYFCQFAAEQNVSIQQQIQRVFVDRRCELFTTRCCINDLQKLIDKHQQKKYIRGAHILRTFKLLPCLHHEHNHEPSKDGDNNNNVNSKSSNKLQSWWSDASNKDAPISNHQANGWKCVNSIDCLQPYIEKKGYCFALQPRAYLAKVRSQPGRPSLWMFQKQIVLDRVSPASRKFMQNNKHLRYRIQAEEHEEHETVDSEDGGNNEKQDMDAFLNEMELDAQQNDSEQDDDDEDEDETERVRSHKHSGREWKQYKQMKQGTKKGYNKMHGKGKKIASSIQYGEHGGFTTVGVQMKRKRKKKTRSKRMKKKQVKQAQDTQVNLNDNTFESKDNAKPVAVDKMKNWWGDQ